MIANVGIIDRLKAVARIVVDEKDDVRLLLLLPIAWRSRNRRTPVANRVVSCRDRGRADDAGGNVRGIDQAVMRAILLSPCSPERGTMRLSPCSPILAVVAIDRAAAPDHHVHSPPRSCPSCCPPSAGSFCRRSRRSWREVDALPPSAIMRLGPRSSTGRFCPRSSSTVEIGALVGLEALAVSAFISDMQNWFSQ